MKRIFSTSKSPVAVDFWLLFLRVFGGAFMITHGLPKMEKLMAGGEISFYDPFGFGDTFALALAVFAEVICASLLIIGLLTRPAAIFLVITMAVAAFMAHAGDPFGKKEMSLLYLLIYVTVLVTGAGRFSIDYLISGKK
ncbi:DoxX family protein [Wandonia haliotis]|uniref:DoxX family protein n=1 Tax=Wandonia haliotis TaxID=574963 RepID=A0ABP3Y535_9FLAO